MTPQDRRLWIDLTAAEYLVALEGEDYPAQERLWALAAADPDRYGPAAENATTNLVINLRDLGHADEAIELEVAEIVQAYRD